MSDGDLHLLTGAYATGALDDAEHDAFVEHLSTCANCRAEVAELVATATVLGVAAAAAPPPGLRDRVLAEIATTRQLPPVVTTLAEATARKKLSRARRAAISAAASAVVLTIGLGAWALSLNEENSDLRHQGDLIAAVQTAPDARTVHAARGDASAALTVSWAQGEMVFLTSGLRNVGAGRTYQLWLLGPGSSVRSMGTFDSAGHEHTTRVLPLSPDATALAVTEEPAGGSARPTTQPVLAMDLPRGT